MLHRVCDTSWPEARCKLSNLLGQRHNVQLEHELDDPVCVLHDKVGELQQLLRVAVGRVE